MIFSKFLTPICLSAALLAGATQVQAAPVDVLVDFDSAVALPLSLDEDSPGIVSDGKCFDPKCLKVNTVGAAVLSIATGTFSIKSFWFELLGKGDDMLVETNKGVLPLLWAIFDNNDGGQFIDVSANVFFQDITYVSFIMACPPDDKKAKKAEGPACAGTGLIDNIALTYDDGKVPPAPVPLPAGGLLLLGGLAGLAALRRRMAA